MATRVSDVVHAHLLRLIVSGRVGPGERLPPERTLADDLEVSRSAVREAVQRLGQEHLVTMRQGDGTRVEDLHRVGGPSLLPVLLQTPDGLDRDLADDVLELRRVIGMDMAELAATGASSRTVDRLGQVLADLGGARTDDERLAATITWWDRVVEAADNLALRLTANATFAAGNLVLAAAPDAFPPGPAPSGCTRLLGAVASGRSDLARSAADDLLTDDRDRVLQSLDR